MAKINEMLKGLREHTGKKPVIYTDINFHEDVLEGELNDHPFWLRSTAAPLAKRYERNRWEFWQFTTTGRVPGIRGDVDRNAFFGSESQFAGWLRGEYDIGTRRWDKREGPAQPGPVQQQPLPPPSAPEPQEPGDVPVARIPGSVPAVASTMRAIDNQVEPVVLD